MPLAPGGVVRPAVLAVLRAAEPLPYLCSRRLAALRADGGLSDVDGKNVYVYYML